MPFCRYILLPKGLALNRLLSTVFDDDVDELASKPRRNLSLLNTESWRFARSNTPASVRCASQSTSPCARDTNEDKEMV